MAERDAYLEHARAILVLVRVETIHAIDISFDGKLTDKLVTIVDQRSIVGGGIGEPDAASVACTEFLRENPIKLIGRHRVV